MSFDRAVKDLNGRLIAPYQHDGVKWMLERECAKKNPGGFLCDEMGLGKTVQLISTILGNPKTRTLIIVPKSIVTQWVEEISKFGPSLSVFVHDGKSRAKTPQDFQGHQIVITPYSLLSHTIFQNVKWDRMILDEGHEVRNKTSKRHKAVKHIRATIKWVVSGTPVYNNFSDFVNLCSIVGFTKLDVQQSSDSIKEDCMLRRTKADISKFNKRLELPPCEFENIEIPMEGKELEMYRAVFTDSKEYIMNVKKSAASINFFMMYILESLLRVRQVMVHPQIYLNSMHEKVKTAAGPGEDVGDPDIWDGGCKKLDVLMENIRTHPKEKSLVFCLFTAEMNMIEKALRAEDIQTYRIDGSVVDQARTNAIKMFKQTKEGAVFLIQIKTGGQGLNLQEATRVYINAPSWNPATELQAIARSHRTGQTQKVFIKKLIYVVEDKELPSIECGMVQLQNAKAIICSEVLNDERLREQVPISNAGITWKEIVRLFMRS